MWEAVLHAFMKEPGCEWPMMDASHAKAHQHAAGAVGGNRDIGLAKGGETQKYIWPWMLAPGGAAFRRLCALPTLTRAAADAAVILAVFFLLHP